MGLLVSFFVRSVSCVAYSSAPSILPQRSSLAQCCVFCLRRSPCPYPGFPYCNFSDVLPLRHAPSSTSFLVTARDPEFLFSPFRMWQLRLLYVAVAFLVILGPRESMLFYRPPVGTDPFMVSPCSGPCLLTV